MSGALRLSLLDGRFAVARLAASTPLPAAPSTAALWSATRTRDELSLVCDESLVPGGARVERGWRAFVLAGPIPFDQVGVIASLTAPLAAAEVPVFVLSTFDTDYLLVRESYLDRTREVLERVTGCEVAMSRGRLEWERDGYVVSTDPGRLDRDAIYGYLVASYWAERIPREVFERSVDNAMCFGLYAPDLTQAGFARVVSDRATVAYLGDVFVLEPHRGRGLSKWMMDCIIGHPELQGLRRWILLTRDAHGLYRKLGFTDLAKPDRWMERWDPDVYQR